MLKGFQGNSEVGHLNLGAGRIVYQDLLRINTSIANGKFFQNSAFLDAIEHVKKNNSHLHLMGLVGGFFGVIIGTLISLGIGKFSTESGFKLLVKVNPELMLFGLLFAFFVGMISGSLPARQAAKLKPVDALRHE